MVLLRLRRRPTLVILLVLALAAAVVAVTSGDGARALTGTTGPVNVTVDPTDNLTDGQTVSISATTTSGTLSEIRAHICMHDQPPGGISNTFDFGFQGEFCTNTAPGAGDFETFKVLANATSG